jgi:hypothetical protein
MIYKVCPTIASSDTSKCMNRREWMYPYLQSIFYNHSFHYISNKWAKEDAKNRWVYASGEIRGI